MTVVDRTWIQKRSTEAVGYKRRLSRYSSTHLVGHGDALSIGTGTTLSALTFEIVKRQADDGALDLQIVTSNLQVIGMGRYSDPDQDPQEVDRFLRAFRATQIVVTGGEVNPSLDSLTGEQAVLGIRDPLFHPTTVFFGARGLSFRGGLTITYQFLDELSAQEAYATRPTQRRVVLCDHEKLGIVKGRQAPLRIESLLEHANECIFVSTVPELARDVPRVNREIAAFQELCSELARKELYTDKELALWMITAEEERRIVASLAKARQEQKGETFAKGGAILDSIGDLPVETQALAPLTDDSPIAAATSSSGSNGQRS